MKVPGVLATALIAGASTFLQVLASGISVLDVWWAPVTVALLGALLKWVDVARPVKKGLMPNGTSRKIENGSKLRRFWLG